MDIPAEIMAAIEADVERYRNGRLEAARKRLTPEYLDKVTKQAEREWVRDRDHRHQIVIWFMNGESIEKIAARFKFIGKNRIKSEIEAWLYDHLNRDDNWKNDNWRSPPRFSEQRWRDCARKLMESKCATQSSSVNMVPIATSN